MNNENNGAPLRMAGPAVITAPAIGGDPAKTLEVSGEYYFAQQRLAAMEKMQSLWRRALAKLSSFLGISPRAQVKRLGVSGSAREEVFGPGK